ncbi:phospholipid ABC transporter ATP-binding protein MlaF [Pseudoalteromonas sp. 13-15]|jgi:phospholipid/cholesterol/gamma-HCH transport system ATP-binding protein|uniref:ATP-binding cassette domain-containing protein n=1 Tax=Pseudoalteromonas marina TaxID=267375 RepID=A0ABT9F8B3_9GAMM|nr:MULTISPECIES: ATP-binding cassette domain-containing protein [Pseudoalteromonas]MBL1386913.1 ATP-binding cassette domain-containing protein [Colwellia sp.]ATG59732.1 phospholipid ABC transporter ATP-binding protein MlaF [Pseudoalteromonas marina]AUL75039.1 phospholipid ABC transporter ATP-binding protein MlaF [Pseudoalteromonas sp. 13-15]MBW4964776.1 ATP-binding cassette domain-containing protein [Pseudoalteromonas sp. CR1]MCK8120289.1 ATP-binding cassette domain-containing protein [Pseudoa|tara:strand:- start:2341 stop:3156 length:816 start_codon:yes stop_codon:yes gene_type:complete
MESDLSQSIVEVKDVSFSRGDRVIYKNMSFSVPKGKITAIMGPSGIGKTTMLRLIGGQLKPDSGDILFEGGSIPSMTRSELYEARTKMSMLFQSGALFTDMSVFDNIAFPIREHTKLSEDLIRLVVLMKLQAVGLRGAKDLMPSELSGGMARRAALARAIALDPELIMYDEPFAGQDPISMGVLVKLIKSLNQVLGLSSLIVTHDVTEVMSIADHVIIIADQGVIGSGTPDEMRNHESELVQQFLKGLSDGPVPFHFPAQAYADELLGEKA